MGQLFVWIVAISFLVLAAWGVWIFAAWSISGIIALALTLFEFATWLLPLAVKISAAAMLLIALYKINKFLFAETVYIGPRGGRYRIRHTRRGGKRYRQYL